MKADAAWRALEGKVAGTDVEYKDCTVWPLIATQPAPVCPPGADPAQMLPAEVGAAGCGEGSHVCGGLLWDVYGGLLALSCSGLEGSAAPPPRRTDQRWRWLPLHY